MAKVHEAPARSMMLCPFQIFPLLSIIDNINYAVQLLLV